jgi:hypothetical protein
MAPDRRWTLAHRVAFTIVYGQIPAGMFVLHSCNNKLCVNVEHLRLGTHKENMDDIARGKYHGRRKLSSAAARLVKRALLLRIDQRKIAAYVGVTQRAVWSIGKGLTYRHD